MTGAAAGGGWAPTAVAVVPHGAWRDAVRAAVECGDREVLRSPERQQLLGQVLVGLWSGGWLRETAQVPPDPGGAVAVDAQPLRDLEEILAIRRWYAAAVDNHPCSWCMVPAGTACVVSAGRAGVHWVRLDREPAPGDTGWAGE